METPFTNDHMGDATFGCMQSTIVFTVDVCLYCITAQSNWIKLQLNSNCRRLIAQLYDWDQFLIRLIVRLGYICRLSFRAYVIGSTINLDYILLFELHYKLWLHNGIFIYFIVLFLLFFWVAGSFNGICYQNSCQYNQPGVCKPVMLRLNNWCILWSIKWINFPCHPTSVKKILTLLHLGSFQVPLWWNCSEFFWRLVLQGLYSRM